MFDYRNINIESYPTNNKDKSQKFSILIPSWNNIDFLQLCIKSIKKNSTYNHQIIVHVNDGQDGTLAWIKRENLDYTYSKDNIGICYALNAMAEIASTNYLLYLNDDMYVCPFWDKFLVDEIAKQNNEYFYFSATMIEPKGNKNACTIACGLGDKILNFREDKLLELQQNFIKDDWFGASWPPSLVHKNLWKKVEGYSVEFSPGFYSDPDFSMKLWYAGVRNFKGIGKSLVYHFQCKSTNRVIHNDGRKTFAKKWGIPVSYFNKKILRLGEHFDESIILNWQKNFAYYLARIKAKLISANIL